MKNAIIHTLLILLSTQCLSQNSFDGDFIEMQARRLQPNGEIYYSEYTMRDYYKIFKRDFKRSLKGIKGDSLLISSSEEKYLKRELRRRVTEKLPDSLFSNSTRKQNDLIVSIVESLNRFHLDSIQKVPGPILGLANFRFWAFSFSRPVYFRNREWMVFYLMYYEGSAGAENLALYRRGLKDWELWGFIGGGTW